MALNDSGSPQPCEVRSGDGSVVRLASVTAVISGAPSNGRKLLANLKAAADAGDLDFDSVAAALHDTVVATNPRGIGAVLDGDQPIAFLFDRAQLRGQVDLAGEGRTGWTTEAIPAGMVEVTVGDELGVVDPRIELVEGRVGGTGTSLLLGGAAVGGISDTTGSSLPARPTLSSNRADLSSAPTASVAASAAAQQLDLTEPDLGQASGTGDDQPAGSAAEITIAASETASVADIDLSDASSTPDADSGDDTEVEAETISAETETISAETETFSAEVETETISAETDTFSAEVETETIDTEVVAETFSAEATFEADEADGNVEDPAEGNLDADSGTDGDDEASSESFGAGASVAGVAAGGAVGLTASQWVSGQASKDDENDDDEKAAASDSPDDVGGSGFGAAERDWAQATPAPTTSGWNRRDDTFDDIPSTFPRSTPPDQQADGPSPGDSQPAPRVPPGSVAAAAADLASAPPAGQPSPPPPGLSDAPPTGLSDAPPPGLSDAPPTGLPRTPPPPPPTGPPVDMPPSPYGAAPPPPPPPGAFDMTAPPTGQPVDVPPSSYGAAVPPPPPPPTDSAPSSEAPSGAMAPPPGAFPAPSPNVPPIPNVPSSEVPPVPPPGFSAAEPPPMPPPGFSAAEPPPMPPPGYGASEPPPSPSAGFSGSIPPIPGGVADHIPPIPDNPAGGDPQGSNSLFDRLRSAADGATSRIPPVPGAERSGTESSEGVEVPDQLKGSGKGFSGLFPNRSSDSDTDRTERNDGDQD